MFSEQVAHLSTPSSRQSATFTSITYKVALNDGTLNPQIVYPFINEAVNETRKKGDGRRGRQSRGSLMMREEKDAEEEKMRKERGGEGKG